MGKQVGGALFAERLVAGSTAPGSRVERFPGGHMGQFDPAVVGRTVDTIAADGAG